MEKAESGGLCQGLASKRALGLGSRARNGPGHSR